MKETAPVTEPVPVLTAAAPVTAPLAVVVIGRNEGSRLVACLESIRAARGMPQPVELIYVDSNSIDGSPERAEEFGAKVIILEQGKQSAARARNAGWRTSTAPFILFLDGDTILESDFVQRAIEELEDPGVAVVWGHRREMHPEASVYNRILDLDWIFAPGRTDYCGGDALMRRSSLRRVNGFNADLIAGEEPDLCRRMRSLGDVILHIDTPMTKHDLAIFRFRQYWSRAVRAGHAYAEIASHYRNTSDPFWTKESRGNLLRGSLYLTISLGMCAAAINFRSWVPLLCSLLCLAILSIRTALSSRWKGVSWSTLLLFGLHSHLQQVPILQGQLLYVVGRWRKQDSPLIEYKEGPQ